MKEQGHFTAEVRLVGISAIAMAIGACCALAALVLLRLIDLFTNLFYFQHLSLQPRSPADHALGWASVLVPMLGGLIVGLMARYGSERIRGHGIPEAMEAILIGRSRMSPKVAILKPVSSAIAIGSGGPFGAEGPIIMTGGSIGSIIAQAFHLTAAERKTLLVAGASGGMSAVFNTPMAAVLLAVEILLFEWKPRSLIPVALAAAVAALLRPYLLGSGAMFPVTPHGLLPTTDLLEAVPVGLLAGLLAMALTLAVYGAEDAFHRLPLHWMWWPVLGGMVEPKALGVGYGLIADLLRGDYVAQALLGLIVVKGLIWSIALGSGTSGGGGGTALDDGMRPGGAGGERLAGGRSRLVAPGEHGRRARGDDAPALDQRDLRPGADPRPQRPAGHVDRLGGLVRPQRPGAEALDPDREGRPAWVSHHPGVRGRSPGAAERRRGDDDRGGDRAGRTPRSRPPQPVLLRRRQIEAFRLPRRGQAREPAGRDHPLGPAGALDHRPDRWVEGCGCAGQWGDHRLRPHQPPVDHRLPLGVVPDRGGADGPDGRETAPRGQPRRPESAHRHRDRGRPAQGAPAALRGRSQARAVLRPRPDPAQTASGMSHDRQSRWYEEGPLQGERKKVRGITLPLIRGAMLRLFGAQEHRPDRALYSDRCCKI